MSATIYIVDWDIPRRPASDRLRFYRALQRLCSEAGATIWDRSTMSVLKTPSRDLAFQVFNLVKGVEGGRGNIYEARLIGTYPEQGRKP